MAVSNPQKVSVPYSTDKNDYVIPEVKTTAAACHTSSAIAYLTTTGWLCNSCQHIEFPIATFHKIIESFPEICAKTEFNVNKFDPCTDKDNKKYTVLSENVRNLLKNFFVICYQNCSKEVALKALSNINSSLEGATISRVSTQKAIQIILSHGTPNSKSLCEHTLAELIKSKPITDTTLSVQEWDKFNDEVDYTVKPSSKACSFLQTNLTYQDEGYPYNSDAKHLMNRVQCIAGLSPLDEATTECLAGIIIYPPFKGVVENCIKKLNELTNVASIEFKTIAHRTKPEYECICVLQHKRPLICLRLQLKGYQFVCNQQYYDNLKQKYGYLISKEHQKLMKNSIIYLEGAEKKITWTENVVVHENITRFKSTGSFVGTFKGSRVKGTITGEITEPSISVAYTQQVKKTKTIVTQAFRWQRL